MTGPALPLLFQRSFPAPRQRAGLVLCLRAALLALVVALLCPLLAAPRALAVEPGEMLADPVLEARARDISRELRCLVCQNQSIDDSNAPLAHDLRVLVRQRLVAGDSNAAVKQYLVARYGDYVLMKPPFKPETWALWLGPPALLLLGAGLVWTVLRRGRTGGRGPVAEAPLSPDEEKRLSKIIDS
jgi:cytochrome c-type biogenesis protein CcmH